jgi:hypothetical protein
MDMGSQTPKLGARIMRYELADYEWTAIRPMLPNKPRGVPRVNDRRVLNGILWVLRSGAPWRDLPVAFGPSQFLPLAERIAAGDSVSVPELTVPIVHEALANGFGWVMLYGGIDVWIMAGISFLIFNAGAVRQPRVQPSE